MINIHTFSRLYIYFDLCHGQVALVVKNPPTNTGRCKRHGFHPWVGKIPWRRAWHPLQPSCLEDPMDRGAWQAAVHRVAQNRTRLKQLSMHAHVDQNMLLI